ncbi:MAG: chromate efflux transporter [Pseudomonadota bacterium]|nr:chromate efflux transporter [Pseudomonadota bacterium]
MLSFGGPAGQIAVMHRLLVDELKWVSEKRFLHALNFCMLLPGPEAQQLTIYLGWLLHRVRGGVVAGVLFVLPGALTVLVLSMIYVTYQQAMAVNSIFFGVKAAVLAIVTTALWRLARKILRNKFLVSITLSAFFASFVFAVPFPIVIVGAALAAYFFGEAPVQTDGLDEDAEGRAIDSRIAAGGSPKPYQALFIAVFCACLWLVPVALLYRWLGAGNVYVQEAMFFSQVAVVTFGGAYAVLSYMAQQTVGHFGWLSAGEMLDGLGMAETTPGPLIMVTQFVGFMGAYRSPGVLDPMMAGCLGALVTTWVTFAPCFLWIFLGAPYIEALRGNRMLAVALTGITAAVVGVVLNLAIWFGLRVMFDDLADVTLPSLGVITVSVPVLSSFDPLASAIIAGALLAITRFGVGMIKVLAVSAATGLALGSVGLV